MVQLDDSFNMSAQSIQRKSLVEPNTSANEKSVDFEEQTLVNKSNSAPYSPNRLISIAN